LPFAQITDIVTRMHSRNFSSIDRNATALGLLALALLRPARS